MKNWISYLQSLERKANERNNFPTEAELVDFCEFTGTTYAQGILLAACVMNRGRRKTVTLSSIYDLLAERIDPKAMNHAFETLVAWGFIEIKADDATDYDPELELNHTVVVALRTHQKILLLGHKKEIHPQEKELLGMYALAVLFLSRSMACTTWQMHCMDFIRKSSHPLAKKIKGIKGGELVKSAALFACVLFYMDWRNLTVRWLSSLFSPNRLRAKMLYDEWMSDNSALLATGMLRLEQGGFGRKILVADYLLPVVEKDKHGEKTAPEALFVPPTLQRITPSSISKRELIYNEDIHTATDELFKLLRPKNFSTYRKRFQKESEFSGVTILLSGMPGTGKTELARQLARESGRELLLFNVSEQRDMYYGESEKKIKQLFEFYKSSAENPATAPILCFNEADSIFQKRASNIGNTAQTENAVQTILLNELEVFSGILICTTNLPKTFDAAFARRFLFRIDIGMPDAEARELLLWQFFPKLDTETCRILAQKYCFSAAQLLNISRKLHISSILRKKKTVLALEIESYLLNELESSANKHRSVVGFDVANRQEYQQAHLK
jgi:AAA+ superfamily predicted ATPase